MKKSIKITGTIGSIVLGICLMGTPLFAATDYSSMSNDELAAMRGTMRDASQDDRDTFRSTWQERVNNMSPEERDSAVARPANASQDGSGLRNGGGRGNGGGQGRGRR